MSIGLPRGMGLPRQATLDAVSAETGHARAKFPGNRYLLAALMEEVGELAKALLQKRPREEWEKEATQVACVAMRIIEEGDALFEDVTDEEAKE